MKKNIFLFSCFTVICAHAMAPEIKKYFAMEQKYRWLFRLPEKTKEEHQKFIQDTLKRTPCELADAYEHYCEQYQLLVRQDENY